MGIVELNFVICSLITTFSSQKVKIFTSVGTLRYETCFCVKNILANSFVWRNNRWIDFTSTFTNIVAKPWNNGCNGANLHFQNYPLRLWVIKSQLPGATIRCQNAPVAIHHVINYRNSYICCELQFRSYLLVSIINISKKIGLLVSLLCCALVTLTWYIQNCPWFIWNWFMSNPCKPGSILKSKLCASGGVFTWKGNTGMSSGQNPLFTPLWQLIRPSVALCSSSEDPSFLKNSWFLTKKIVIFFNFVTPKAHFSPEFQLFNSKFL